MVHHVNGRFPDVYYHELSIRRVREETDERFDLSRNVYLIVLDVSNRLVDGAGGRGKDFGPEGGMAFVPAPSELDPGCRDVEVAAHELGHAFGVPHDRLRNANRRPSSYCSDWMTSSFCAAEWLDAHRYFNIGQTYPEKDELTTIQMLPPLVSPPNAIRLNFEITDADGLHQAQIILGARTALNGDLVACQRLHGQSETYEFELIPTLDGVHSDLVLRVIDVHGNFTQKHYPIDSSLLSPLLTQVVSIPDANLATAIRRALYLATSDTFTQRNLLRLTKLDAGDRQITDLTGLEHTTQLSQLTLWVNQITDINVLAELLNLRWLSLAQNQITDISVLAELPNLRWLYLAQNQITDISVLAGLPILSQLDLSGNQITDISSLVELPNLRWLSLAQNQITDISVLADLTNLASLYLSNTSVSDILVLSGLTNLTTLDLSNLGITDISALSGLTNLTTLYLWGNSISDLSPLVANTGLGGGDEVHVQGNPLSYQSIHIHIPALQSRRVTVEFDNRTPTTLVKISEAEQQALVNTALSHPFVVEVRDQHNRAFSGVPVTFAVTAGGGKLGATRATTDENGRVQVRLTLGQTVGTTTVSVAVPEISQPVRFTATALLLSSPVTVPDAALRARIATTLGKPPSGSLTVGDMLRLTALTANNANIRELTGLHHASNLTTLSLDNNSLSDVSSLAGLPKLKILSLDDNNLSDVSSLGELTQLTTLSLDNNNLSDISTLVGLTQLKRLHLRGNPLSYPSLRTHIPAMQASGVVVTVDPRTPTTLLNISGAHGVAGTAIPFVVEVQDQHNRAFSGVPVTFAVTVGGGKLSATTATTDITGRARTTLTLGGTPGKNTVRVSAAEVPQAVHFTITAIDANSSVTVPDAALRAKIAQTLGKPGAGQLTAGDMLVLTRLDAPNANIQDLTGLEYAHNLRTLNLGGEWVSGQGYVNSNAVSNFSSLLGLTQLRTLNVSGTSLSDVSALSGLTQLTQLNLNNTSISDVSVLAGLTQLNALYLSNTSISDVSALSGLTQLNALYLSNTSISDVSTLVGLTQLTTLNLNNTSISDVSVLVGLTKLNALYLSSTSISDVSALSGLTQLTTLHLSGTSISDVSALSGLTQLNVLNLRYNAISDVSPLLGLNLTGTEWDSTGLYLEGNPLSYASINTHIPAMQAKGVEVKFDNRTPTTLVQISETEQQATVNAALALPFVVEVRDQRNRVFSGVPVTFTITAGGGTLSAARTTTDENGRAQVRLTLGQTAGTTTVSVSAVEISQPVRFTATALLLSSLVTVPDAALRTKIAQTLGKLSSGSLTVGDMLRLTALTANNANIRELTGLHHAANLTTLSLDNNSLSDVSSLAGLLKLKTLSLDDNHLSDMSSLGELTQLTTLSLDNNSLSNVAPLAVLTQLKTLHLRGNPLSYPSLRTHIPAIQASGVVVTVDPRTPTTLLNVSGAHGVAGTAIPLVVEVQDQHNRTFSGVPVTFAVTVGGGKLSATTATTDINGRARTTLTLGGTPGKNTVRVSAAEIPQPVRFTITAIDANSSVTVPDAALRAKIAQTLGKPGNVQLTAGDMLALTRLDAPNANIQDLTGLEYAHNLRTLNLGGEWVSGQGYVNSNAVSNFSSLLGLTQLTQLNLSSTSLSDVSTLAGLTQLNWLYLSYTSISDVSALAGLTQLTLLDLNNTSISDVSALSGLTQLNWLYLSNTSISDVSALSGLTQLTTLNLSNTSISDVSALSGLTQLTTLNLSSTSISDVSPLAGLTQLNVLYLYNNAISDVSPLAGLTQLNTLYLSNTSISDVSALARLTQLTFLDLRYNAISDVSALLGLNLTGTSWDSTGLYLNGNPLSYPSINTHIPTLQSRGIGVKFDNRTPTTLVKISGTAQQALVDTTLSHPFVVEVRDQRNRAFSGVPVTFTVTTGGGKLSTTRTTTDENGRAQVRLTLGQTAGTITVSVAAAEISQSVRFTATALLLSSPVTVPDAALRARIAQTLGKLSSGSLTVGDMLRLTTLIANNTNIRELTGLHYAANLTTLSLDNNNLSDVSLLVGLPQLETLSLDDNNLSNVSSLGELTQLMTLSLDNNSLSDVAPLAALTQLKTLHLRGNPLSYPSLRTHIPAMQARGVVVTVDPRMPTRLLNISSTHGVTGATLPFVVEVQDQHNRAFSGVPVAFAVTAGGGHLSAPTAITNITGRARTTLTLGEMPGKNTVRVSVAEVPQPVRFTITAIDVSFLVTIPDAALRAKIAETLGKSGGVQLTAGDMLGLTRLDALNANIQDLTGLEYAYNLTTLNLGGEWVSGKGYVNSNAVSNFSSLLGLTQLTTLNLVGSFISDVSALSGLTQLNTLVLSNNAISDVSPLAGLTQLNTLVLSNNAISDVSSLSGLTQLNVLNLSGNTISDVSALSGLTQLKWLYLSGTSISDVSALAGLTQLTRLELSGTSISDVSALAGLTQLNWLVLGGTSISDVSPLAGLTQLTTLYLNRTSISDVSALSGLIKMQFLSLAGTSISDVSALAGLTRLNWLDLSRTSLSDVSALVELTQLTQLNLRYNAISDVSSLVGLNLTGTAWDSTGLYLERNPLSYASINTHIPAMQAKGIEVKFDNRTPTTLVKISGAEQQATVNAVLPHPFVVEVRDERNRAFSGVPVTFTVTAGGGTLSVTNTTTNENGRAQTTLTLGPNPETNTVEVAAAEIKTPVTFNAVPGGHLLSVPAGISLIHVPLKVTAVDGVAKPITSISDLYDALGGADTVNFLITYDSQTQQWFGYFGPSDTGTPDDRGVTDDTGIIAGMITPVTIRLIGNPLGTNGSSTITLNPGFNLVGLPLKDPRITRVSDLFALDGIGGNVHRITLTDSGKLQLVERAGDPSDIPIMGGQSFFLRALRRAIVVISGDGWYNASGIAASPPIALKGIEVDDVTPVLGVRGSIVDEQMGTNRAGFRVIVKNLSTGRAVAAVTKNVPPSRTDNRESTVALNPDLIGRGDYQVTIVDVETGRAARIGDSIEISARSSSPLIGVEPLRYTVTAEDVKQSLIQLTELVAYEIPTETELLANYPNPFNPETWIPYRLAEDAFVTLTIYDGSGRVIRTLDVGPRIAAVYERRSKAVYWDGRNRLGEQVASGVYFYTLSADDYFATRKMVILK